ncbi:MAG TPA: hypothetical protein VGV18_05465, partial [Verrucomicrobiae bacterium]|nr:hypothetical protein [Verrucomicrobiae bacterium]
MKATKKIYGIALALACCISPTLKGQNLIYVANDAGLNTIGEYTDSGSTVNASLITGLLSPYGIAISGNDLFVANYLGYTVGEYTTSGSTINASLIGGLGSPYNVAISGNDLFVADAG